MDQKSGSEGISQVEAGGRSHASWSDVWVVGLGGGGAGALYSEVNA